MVIRLLFWFLLLYFLLRFLIKVIIPVVIATRNVNSKMRDINGNQDNYKSPETSSSTYKEPSRAKSGSASAKDDYIEFEEIKWCLHSFNLTGAGSSSKTIQNNIFSKWFEGTGSVNVINVNITGTNAFTGNAINNISGRAAVTGIGTAAGNDKIYFNTSNFAFCNHDRSGRRNLVSVGTNKNICNNKILVLWLIMTKVRLAVSQFRG